MLKILAITTILLSTVFLVADLCAVEPAKEKSKIDYEKLVADLVNRNPAPSPSQMNGHRIVFAKDYDWKEVTRVDKSLQIIIDNFDEAWPTLVKHAYDKEYSLSARLEFEESEERNYSVGDLCRRLLQENLTNVALKLNQFTDVVEWKTLRRAAFISVTKTDSSKFQNWFMEQVKKNRKFYELQIEYAESAIDFIPKKYFEDAKMKDHVESAVNNYRKEIEQVKAKKEPVLMSRFNIPEGRYIIKENPNAKK